jgi:hypothetical protein
VPSKNKPNSNDFFSGEETAQSQQIATLEESLQSIKDSRYEERFYFVTAIILLFDIIALKDAPIYLAIPVIIMEFIVWATLAERWGVEQIAFWIKRLEALAHTYCAARKSKKNSQDDTKQP